MFITIEQHRRLSEAVRSVVAAVTPTDLHRSTPCTEWDVNQLLAHMIGQDHGFATALAADVGIEAFAPRPVGDRPLDAYVASSTAVTSAFAAADSDRAVLLPDLGADARFPAHLALDFHGLDVAVHGWDLAVAIGSTLEYDADLIETTLSIARLIPTGPERTEPGALFGPALTGDADAGPWPQVLRLVGRDPQWRQRSDRAEVSHR